MADKFIPYGCQYIDDDDIAAVVQALRDPLITQGPMVEKFEAAVAEYCGARYAVAYNSGTSALHGAMYAAGVGPGDEVITSTMTFAASANAAVYMGARPVLGDIDPKNYCLDIAGFKKAISGKTKAVIPVDYAGYPVDIAAIMEIAHDHNLVVVEDAAHALGAIRNGSRVGSQADMTMFSFHPVKHITTGEGGMIVCNEERYYHRLKLFRSHGITRDEEMLTANEGPWYYEMQELGYNYRITDIQCALGFSQLKKLETFIERRNELAAHYDKALAAVDWIEVPPRPPGECRHAYHLYPIMVKDGVDRKEFFTYLRAASIGVQVHYIPVHCHPFYRRCFGYSAGDFPVAETFYAKEISLPMFASLSDADQDSVIQHILNYRPAV
ncbi:MAG: UDP-4-amino-4,6-dideoxy-N-acetyl-beta-L-altrosamine transaminase [Syntrophomonadaceae bacterium]|nr:UDP-4-amino-4,6-dideoxy-N-acetyl-beta-L-altrosamine transaminase [Syntrophomonadaceae bacterium]